MLGKRKGSNHVATIKLSEKPCVLCKSKEHTIFLKLKDGTFRGVVCLKHMLRLLGADLKAIEKPSVADAK
jgi:hypothetical protein